MTDAELFTELQPVVRDARNACTEPQQRAHLDRVHAALWHRLQQERRAQSVPLVLRIPVSGYVEVGRQGEERTYRRPSQDLAGLDYAAAIFQHGSTVRHTLHANDLVGPVKHPGNALRNRLRAAAKWIERETGCRDVADALRPPRLSISRDGLITIDLRTEADAF